MGVLFTDGSHYFFSFRNFFVFLQRIRVIPITFKNATVNHTVFVKPLNFKVMKREIFLYSYWDGLRVVAVYRIEYVLHQ